jgi:hypothetical protein
MVVKVNMEWCGKWYDMSECQMGCKRNETGWRMCECDEWNIVMDVEMKNSLLGWKSMQTMAVLTV